MLENFLLLYFFIHLSGPSIFLLIYISSHSLSSLCFNLHVSTLSSLFSLLSLITFLYLPLWPNLDWSKYLCLKLRQPWISPCRSPHLVADLVMSSSIDRRWSCHVVIHSSPPTRSVVLHTTHHLNLLSVVLHEGVRFGMCFEIWKCGGLWGSVWIGGSDVLWLWAVVLWLWRWFLVWFFFFVVVDFCCDYGYFFGLVVGLKLWWWWGFRSSVGGLWVVVL